MTRRRNEKRRCQRVFYLRRRFRQKFPTEGPSRRISPLTCRITLTSPHLPLQRMTLQTLPLQCRRNCHLVNPGWGRHKTALSALSGLGAGAGLRHQAVVSSPLRKSFDGSGAGLPISSSFGGVGRRLFEGESASIDGSGEGGATAGVRHPTPLESGIDLHS